MPTLCCRYADATGCYGIAMDPTVVHPARIHKNVTFHMIGARSLDDEINALWQVVTSPAGLRHWQVRLAAGSQEQVLLRMSCACVTWQKQVDVNALWQVFIWPAGLRHWQVCKWERTRILC